jgi:hypothetical protein
METIAKKFRLFESHSQTRTEAGSRLAAAVGDQLSPAADVPENGEIDEGGHLTYMLILLARPDLTGLLDA